MMIMGNIGPCAAPGPARYDAPHHEAEAARGRGTPVERRSRLPCRPGPSCPSMAFSCAWRAYSAAGLARSIRPRSPGGPWEPHGAPRPSSRPLHARRLGQAPCGAFLALRRAGSPQGSPACPNRKAPQAPQPGGCRQVQHPRPGIFGWKFGPGIFRDRISGPGSRSGKMVEAFTGKGPGTGPSSSAVRLPRALSLHRERPRLRRDCPNLPAVGQL